MVFAVAEVESHFNPQAVSAVGAIGIMQIMPSTGEWIASVLCVPDYNVDDLFDPELNLRFGTFYLSYLFSVFSEEWQIIASYNAGEGVVRGWIDENVTFDSIPYHETLDYVRKVKRALSRYRRKKYAAFD